MCGLAGFLAHDDAAHAPSEATLRAVRDHMRSRGPDGEGLWIDSGGRAGLAHRRLSIIELSEAGAQPMASADGRLRIVFNGEIYNFQALRDDLERAGAALSSHSDTEVLLHLYARHGAAMLPMLRGMFAFAIWDARDRSLFLARDPYGIKPLYISDSGGCFRFASQVKALLRDPAVSRDPSPAGLASFHLFGAVREPFTIYRAIHALPAGAHLRVDAKGPGEPVRWARIAEVLASATPGPVDSRAAFRDSVAHHLVADVEVGAFLSGGVDSGALVGLMRDCGQNRIKTCTLAFSEFSGTEHDETPRAREIAAHYGVEHHVRHVETAEFEADLPAIFAAMDQPSVDGINSWFVSKACHELGLKVALSGVGGDELLAGYSTFRTVPRMHRLAGPAAHVPFLAAMTRKLIRGALPALARRNPKAAGVLDYSGSWAGAYLLRRAVLLPFELDDVMDPAMALEGLAELDPLQRIGESIDPDPGSDVARVCALESANYMRNQLLRDTDWASMAHSLEVRTPLVDFTLLKALAPMMATLNDGVGKTLLANAPVKPLPAAIVNRAKTGFAVPVRDWTTHREHHVEDRRDSRHWATRALGLYGASA